MIGGNQNTAKKLRKLELGGSAIVTVWASYRELARPQIRETGELAPFLDKQERLVWSGAPVYRPVWALEIVNGLVSALAAACAVVGFAVMSFGLARGLPLSWLAPIPVLIAVAAVWSSAAALADRRRQNTMVYGVSDRRVVSASNGAQCWIRSVFPQALPTSPGSALSSCRSLFPAISGPVARSAAEQAIAFLAESQGDGLPTLPAVFVSYTPSPTFAGVLEQLCARDEQVLWSRPALRFDNPVGLAITSERVLSYERGVIRQVSLKDIGVVALEMVPDTDVGTIFLGAGDDLKFQNSVALVDVLGAARVHSRLIHLLME